MLKFKKLSLEDKENMERLCYKECCPGPENCFNNMFIWQRHYKPEICYFESQIIMKLTAYNKTAFSYPMGEGALETAVDAVRAYCEELALPVILMGHGEAQAEKLEKAYPGRFDFMWDRDYSAYVHSINNLAEYPGKSLHSKRNFCNYFEANNNWEFVPITAELIPACMDFMENWLMDNAERLDPSASHELTALTLAFDNFARLGMEGGALYADGRMVGFTMGEKCTENCFVCHFEKADGNIKGAYPMTCRELARMVRSKHPTVQFINREEDMGIEALRRSKLSYKPDFMVPQFFARWKDE